jgi:YidC/Oxa1 family membrane protein insertase
LINSIGLPGFFSRFTGSGEEGVPTQYVGDNLWAGIDLKYFIAAILPDRTRTADVVFQPLVPGKVGAMVLFFAPVQLPPGQIIEHEFEGYMGPKVPELLDAAGSELSKSINLGYGWIAPLTSFFAWLLRAIYEIVPNYGVAIIILTVMVRIVTLPIMGKQMKSMERMRALQPRVKELQAKHTDDRQKQSEAMMKLYKEEGVNPMGGCLPMLLQFPVFIGLFFALQSSIELRDAPFFGYITDLSAPANLFVIPGIDLPVRLLPILMGLSMVVQQRMTPMTMDPAQARMMMTVMPVMMTVLFYQFPSGLVLYWMVSNLLGIAHQYWVGHKQRAAA